MKEKFKNKGKQWMMKVEITDAENVINSSTSPKLISYSEYFN